MRLVIEVTDAERSALGKLTASLNTTYSALFRALLRLTAEGTVPKKQLLAALAAPRPVLNVTLKLESAPREKEKSSTSKHGWDNL